MLVALLACSQPKEAAPAWGLDARPVNATCLAPDRPATGAAVGLERVFSDLSFDYAVQILQAPDDAGRWFVVGQDGYVWSFDAATGADLAVALDLTDRADHAYTESGL